MLHGLMLESPEQMGLSVSPEACDIEGYELVSIILKIYLKILE
jgi:hypothetical protein